MALPTLPTVTTICQEALYKAGYTNIPSTIQSRAETKWMDELKSDIMLNNNKNSRKLKSLFTTAYTITTIGTHRYSNPSDYSSDLNLLLMTGENTGIAQTGAVNSVTLASNEDVTSDFIIGKYILMTGGTSLYSCSQVISYSETTKVATVSPDFVTAPMLNDTYMIIDRTRNLIEKDVVQFDIITNVVKSEPINYYPIGSTTYGEFILYPTPDKVYGLQMRYFSNLLRIDLSSTLMSTLYEKWRSIWVQGIYMKALQDIDDKKANTEKKIFYEFTLPSFIEKESYGVDWSELQFNVKF